MERHEKSPRFVAQSFGDMVQSPRESAWLPDVEVFSQSAKAWLPGRVSLLAAPGKITVCYSLEAKLCAKHMKHCSKFCKATRSTSCNMSDAIQFALKLGFQRLVPEKKRVVKYSVSLSS